MVISSEGEEPGSADGKGVAGSLDGCFKRCSRCGSIYVTRAGAIHRPWRGRVAHLRCMRDGCILRPVTEEQASATISLSRRDVLWRVYGQLRQQELTKRPREPAVFEIAARAEVERRLGLSPIELFGPARNEFKADSVSEALRILTTEALVAVPVIDAERIEFEYPSLRRVWGSQKLWNGSPEAAVIVLRRNLEPDIRRPDFRYFRVDVLRHNWCAQVNVIFDGRFVAYRIWRGEDQVFLCGPRGASL
jgi:hypothetical protein